MAINSADVLDAVVSHAMKLGVFETVNTFEAQKPPGHGLRVSIWFEELVPIQSSGLNVTSVRMQFLIRIYSTMNQGPLEQLDPNLVAAVDTLMQAFNNDYTLLSAAGNDMVRQVDIFGAEGEPLAARSGYIPMEENTEARVVDITLPLIIDDVWEQGA